MVDEQQRSLFPERSPGTFLCSPTPIGGERGTVEEQPTCGNGDGRPLLARGLCGRCYHRAYRAEHADEIQARVDRNRDEINRRQNERRAAEREAHREERSAAIEAKRAARQARLCANGDEGVVAARGLCARCYGRLRYREHRDETLAYQSAWRAEHRDQINARQNERRAARRAAEVGK